MTLIEVTVATVLLGMVSLVIVSAFGLGLRAAWMAQQLDMAAGLAEEALLDRAAAPCGSSLLRTDLPDAPSALAHTYRRTVEVTRAAGTHLWDIRSTVSWVRGGRVHHVTLATRRYTSAACAYVGR
jgi:type II secretory pathway pseudopilin PulG